MDGGFWCCLCVLLVFWVGLLYENDLLDVCWDLVKDWSIEECEILRVSVLKSGLNIKFCILIV